MEIEEVISYIGDIEDNLFVFQSAELVLLLDAVDNLYRTIKLYTQEQE